MKTTVRHQQSLLEWLKLERLAIPTASKAVEQSELTHTSQGKAPLDNHFGKEFGSLLRKTHLPCDPGIPLLASYSPKEKKAMSMQRLVYTF